MAMVYNEKLLGVGVFMVGLILGALFCVFFLLPAIFPPTCWEITSPDGGIHQMVVSGRDYPDALMGGEPTSFNAGDVYVVDDSRWAEFFHNVTIKLCTAVHEPECPAQCVFPADKLNIRENIIETKKQACGSFCGYRIGNSTEIWIGFKED